MHRPHTSKQAWPRPRLSRVSCQLLGQLLATGLTPGKCFCFHLNVAVPHILHLYHTLQSCPRTSEQSGNCVCKTCGRSFCKVRVLERNTGVRQTFTSQLRKGSEAVQLELPRCPTSDSQAASPLRTREHTATSTGLDLTDCFGCQCACWVRGCPNSIPPLH